MHSASSCLWVFVGRCQLNIILFVLHSEDFANQVRYSSLYEAEIRRHKMAPDKYLSPEAGEFVSGVAEERCVLGLGSCFDLTLDLQACH